jgi:hypothetical protein
MTSISKIPFGLKPLSPDNNNSRILFNQKPDGDPLHIRLSNGDLTEDELSYYTIEGTIVELLYSHERFMRRFMRGKEEASKVVNNLNTTVIEIEALQEKLKELEKRNK